MRQKTFRIAAGCILATAGLLPVFSYGASPVGKERVIYSFKGGADGAIPFSELTLDGAGNLYGTTQWWGTGTACNGGCGTVFELKRTPDSWREELLFSFTGGKDGSYPGAGVIFDSSGNLYGTTETGGNQGSGTVFKLAPNSKGGWTESVIYNFDDGNSGVNPAADLVFDAHGNLYGTTPTGGSGICPSGTGCGAVFELIPQPDGSWRETTLHTFMGAPDGGVPYGLALDDVGNPYGLTQLGGTGKCHPLSSYHELADCGTLYKLTPGPGESWTETILYNSVRGAGRGIYPSGTLLFDNVDHVFGVTQYGGDGVGTVVELNHSHDKGWQQNVLHIFQGFPRDGIAPMGRLVMDANGDVFGVTEWGVGAQGNGIVFELEHSTKGWRENVLHYFAGSPDGANPTAGLVFDAQGNLYGTTALGGTDNYGTVFEVTP